MGKVLVAVAAGEENDPAGIEEARAMLNTKHEYVPLTVQEGGGGILPLAATGTPDLPPAVRPDSTTLEQIERRASQEAQGYLQNLVDVLYIKAEIQVQSGEAADRICATAAEQNVYLIVLRSSTANFVQRTLGLSTADQVAHHAPCPVLLIRQGESDRVPTPENQ